MANTAIAISGWEKAIMAAERVKERLRRAARALDDVGVAYAVVGGNAVAEWVARIDEGAVRTTRDVDLLVRREDFDRVRVALEGVGFVHHRILGLDTFLDGDTGRPSEGLHILYAGEKVNPGDQHALPEVGDSERGIDFQVANLEALVLMKLIANRRKDQVHLLDLIGVGQIDSTWPARFPPPLGERLQALLDDPGG